MQARDAALRARRGAQGDPRARRGDRLTDPPGRGNPSAKASRRRRLFGGPPNPGSDRKRSPFTQVVVLVDLDGTLVDSEETNHKAFLQIFREFHLEDKIPTVFEGLATGRDFAGIMADIGLDTKTRHMMEQRMEEIVSASDLHVLPYAPEAIRELKRRGVKFSIATLNVSKKALEILTRNKMDDLFERELVVGSDNLPWEKPNPQVVFEVLRRSGRSRAIIVGNAPRDVMLAKNCNLPIIYLKAVVPESSALSHGEDTIKVFSDRVKELETRYDHQKIFWGSSWKEIPAIVERILKSK